jgi:ABC-type sugar transport system ATPase subunit
MGRAIVRQPQVFLFDEPLSNLDAKLRVQMRSEIKQLHQRLKTTIIYVTHDQIEAMTMADRIVVMRDGYVEQIGSPLDLYDRPANLFVAGFIGSPGMNFIKGKVSTEGPIEFIADGGTRLPIPEIPSLERGQDIVWGIRPEHLVITSGRLDGKGHAHRADWRRDTDNGNIGDHTNRRDRSGPLRIAVRRRDLNHTRSHEGAHLRRQDGEVREKALTH